MTPAEAVQPGQNPPPDAYPVLPPDKALPWEAASGYAAGLVESARREAVGPSDVVPRTVRRAGVVGAGLMARQLALIFARQLEVPVVITDLSQAAVDTALAAIQAHLEKQVLRGQLSQSEAHAISGRITGSVDKREFADCDAVIEAVFEEVNVKRTVFAELEQVVRRDALLLTNTSSLSVGGMGQDLEHPERLVGLHFFNPVAVLPLVEIVRTAKSDDASVATACSIARLLGKTAVLVADTPGFVVNRLLTRLFCELLQIIDGGAEVERADHALDPLGLPMTPLTLLGFIGPAVQLHICETMHAAYPDRFHVSTSLKAVTAAGLPGYRDKHGALLPEVAALLAPAAGRDGRQSLDAQQIRSRLLESLAHEVGLMLSEQVVPRPEDIDLCMLLGANYPAHLGGLTPYLDQSGASRHVWGRDFHPDSRFTAPQPLT